MPGPNVLTPVPVEELKQRRIGRVLTKFGKVTREQVQAALVAQQGPEKGKKIGQILLAQEVIDQQTLDIALAGQYGFEYVDLADAEIPAEVLSAILPTTATTYKVVPLEHDAAARSLTIAMKSRDNFRAIDDLKNLMGFAEVKCVVASGAQIDELIAKHYGGKSAQAFKRYNKALLARPDIAFHAMPSTSPANARWRLPMLEETWRKALTESGILCYTENKN